MVLCIGCNESSKWIELCIVFVMTRGKRRHWGGDEDLLQ